jgi:hypothetical protein
VCLNTYAPILSLRFFLCGQNNKKQKAIYVYIYMCVYIYIYVCIYPLSHATRGKVSCMCSQKLIKKIKKKLKKARGRPSLCVTDHNSVTVSEKMRHVVAGMCSGAVFICSSPPGTTRRPDRRGLRCRENYTEPARWQDTEMEGLRPRHLQRLQCRHREGPPRAAGVHHSTAANRGDQGTTDLITASFFTRYTSIYS